MATFTTTKQRTTGLLKKLAFAAALSACSFANAGVLTFEGENAQPIVFAGDRLEFGNYWVESYGGPLTTDLTGLLINGASQGDICDGYKCPTNNQSTYFAGLGDSYLYFGLNNNGNFRVKSLDASFISGNEPGLPSTAGYVVMQGFDSNNATVGSAINVPLFKEDATGQFKFSSFDLGLFSNNMVNYVRVLGYACSAAGCFRNTNLANFAIDNIVTIDAAVIPEPASLGLIGLGLLGLGAFSRKRKA